VKFIIDLSSSSKSKKKKRKKERKKEAIVRLFIVVGVVNHLLFCTVGLFGFKLSAY
jgi:nitrate reductase NapE component